MNNYNETSQDTNSQRAAEDFKIKLRIYLQLAAIAALILSIAIGFYMMSNDIFFFQAAAVLGFTLDFGWMILGIVSTVLSIRNLIVIMRHPAKRTGYLVLTMVFFAGGIFLWLVGFVVIFNEMASHIEFMEIIKHMLN